MRKIYRLFLIIVLLVYAVNASAELKIEPGIALEGQYNDNLFLSNSNKDDDFLTTITPGIKFIYKSPKSIDLSLDYGLHFRYYADHSELNDTDIKETQRIRLNSQLRPFKRFFIDVTDTYDRVPVDIRGNSVADNPYNMTDRNIFTVSPYIMFPVTSSISLKAGYRYSETWHRDNESVDSYTNAAYCSLTKKITRKLNGAINYDYSAFRPEVQDDGEFDKYDRHQGGLGFDYQMTGKIRLDGEVGKIWTDFDEKDDVENVFWNAGIEYNLRDERMTVFKAKYASSLNDSAIDGAYEEKRVDIDFETGRIVKLSINSFYSESEYINTDRNDKVGGVGFEILKPLSNKIDLETGVNWQAEKFSELSVYEKAYRYSLQAGVEYAISRHFSTSAEYRFNSRDSDINNSDFNNNIVAVNARARY